MPISSNAATQAAGATLGGKSLAEWRARQAALRAQQAAQLGLGTGTTIPPLTPTFPVQNLGGVGANALPPGGVSPGQLIPTPSAMPEIPVAAPPTVNAGSAGYARPMPTGAVPSAGAGSAGAGTATGGVSSAAESAAAQTANLEKYTLGEADFATQAGNGLSGWRAIAAKTPSPFVEGSSAMSAFAPGTIGRAGLYGIGGQVAGNIWDRAIGERDGTWDDAVGSALRWGGAGAGIGSMILPGVGTVVGGGIGAAIGGVKGWITGDDSPGTERDNYLAQQIDPNHKGSLVATLDKYGLSDKSKSDILMQLEAIGPTLGDKDQAKQLISQLVGNLPAIKQQDEQDQKMQARAAAIQTYLGPMIQQQMDRYNQSAQQASTLTASAADQTSDPALASMYKAHAAALLTNSNEAGMGYLAQLAVAPQLYGQQATGSPSSYAGAGATFPQQSTVYQDAYDRALAAANAKQAATGGGSTSYTP